MYSTRWHAIKLLLVNLLGLVGQGESKTNQKAGGECLCMPHFCTNHPHPSLSQASDSTQFEWCPDGVHFVTATTAPRLRVGNGYVCNIKSSLCACVRVCVFIMHVTSLPVCIIIQIQGVALLWYFSTV